MFGIEFIVPCEPFMSTGGLYEIKKSYPYCFYTESVIFRL